MSKRGENIYKRKDGRWEGRYVKCRTLHGKIQYGYVYGKSYSETKAKLKETASAPIRSSSCQATQSALYDEVLKAWLLSSKNRVKESTFSRYNHLVERHIQPLLGRYPISEISTVLLEECIDYLLQNGRLDGSGGLSPKSVSDIIVVMKSSIRYALGNGYPVNCSPAGLSVKRSKKDMRVLSKKEQQQLECILMQDTDLTKFTVLLCLYTGIRIGEACALRWEHLRLDIGILEVRETMQRIQVQQNIATKTKVIITEPKSACSKRDIPLPRFLIQYAAQFQTDRKAYAFDHVSGKALISDDTQMTLFTANGILFGETRGRMRGIGAAPHDYVAMAYQDWLTTQYADYRTGSRTKRYDCGRGVSWLLDVPELYSRRAPGNTCISALSEARKNRNAGDYIECPRNISKGCGGIMRVAPLGIHDANTPIEWLGQEGAYLSAITHGHPLGYLPAAVLTHILNRIVFPREKQMTLPEIIDEAAEATRRLFDGTDYLDDLCAIIDKAVRLAANHDTDRSNIRELGGGWVAEETLAIAIYCALRYEHDFSAGVIAAVNHDGDSDSTGAVTGNILGAINGFDSIEAKWKNDLELMDVLLEMSDDLCQGCLMSEYDTYYDPDWARKYIEAHWKPER